MTVEQLTNPHHKSIPRNQLLAMLFYDAGIIEQYGSGIQRILDDCQKNGFPAPQFKEVDHGFQVILFKDIFTEEFLQKKGLNERQRKAIRYVKEKGKITNKEYRELTSLSDEGARTDLNMLVSSGIFRQQGKGRTSHYTLKKLGD